MPPKRKANVRAGQRLSGPLVYVDPEATTKDPFNGLKPGSQISRDSTLWGLSTVPTFSPEESSPMSRPSESEELNYPKNGGKDCPKKLLRRKKCKLDPCDPEEQQDIQTPSWEPYYMPPPGVVIDCELSEWTPWSSCSMSCGSHAVRQRTRSIIAHPSQNGLQCGNRLETEPCKLLPCKA
uniref:Spondin-like TSP1 domain-containing protein n=1 Tax=Timema tahoe TaxID=61484 RepID=A0A7R9IE78_9NEOP|nr:unnamed protein product [Timema tahoe]